MAPPKPTLFAIHGSGSNGTIHSVQLARLSRFLNDDFDIVSLEAPFSSAAGPGVLPFFEGCGPFKRWITPSEKVSLEAMKRGEASGVMPGPVEDMLKEAVAQVKQSGGTVAGLIGFSQGTRIVAGLLKGSEIARRVRGAEDLAWLDFPFALSVCASYPPPVVPAAALAALEKAPMSQEDRKALLKGKIQVPTMHVLGTQDEWAWTGRILIDEAYERGEGKSVEVEFDMGHNYPVQNEDNEKIRDWVFGTWKRTGGGGGKR